MRIVFLIHNAYGIGGTIRSAVNLSGALADRHEVEVVSVHQVADAPQLAFDQRVRLTPLIDMREDSPTYDGDHASAQRPNTMFPDVGVDLGRLRYTALHDERVAACLAATDADAVIATRPILNGYLARYGSSRYLRVGQEHLSLAAHSEQLSADQNAAIRRLDAFVTVSEADAAHYREALPDAPTTIRCIPNAVPAPAVRTATLNSRTVVAAGRLVPVKRYDRLIRAFAEVSPSCPDWSLRLYGRGPDKPRLRALIEELGLYDTVRLMGAVSPIETEWAKGAVAAVSSDMESFGMTIVEAMHCGVPVVATDCPHGPAEIISHHRNGLLVPLSPSTGDDVSAYASALRTLMEDDGLRRELGSSAQVTAARYSPDGIARQYQDLLQEAASRRRKAGPGPKRFGRLRGLLRPGASTAKVTVPPAPPTARPAETGEGGPAVRPSASARALLGGAVEVRFHDAALLSPGPLDFVARLRRDPHQRTVRRPVSATAAAEGSRDLVLVLDHAAERLPEGRWDCYLAPRDGDTRLRLRATLVEQARLLETPLTCGPDGLFHQIPYTTTDGYLALRTWRRTAHAEVTRVSVGDHRATVTARLFTTTDASPHGATVRATRRASDTTADDVFFDVPVEVIGTDAIRFQLPYQPAQSRYVSEHDVWDLSLHLRHVPTPVPVGRIAADGVDRKRTDVCPASLLPHPSRDTTTRVRPFFTAANNLALSVRDHTP
ncbi:glycosyltransferase family 4 protein [Streptomyces sp. NPDC007088]|uniref:glycosyltransferase family 4 protein n=1 Tax=Streptomyces sp. NPDC007088 TaxID=3364773 RepID=UPI00368A809E